MKIVVDEEAQKIYNDLIHLTLQYGGINVFPIVRKVLDITFIANVSLNEDRIQKDPPRQENDSKKSTKKE